VVRTKPRPIKCCHGQPKAMLNHWNTGIYLDGYLYACSGRNPPDADLRCIDWKTGKVQWVEQLPPEERERSSLLYVDGHFVQLGEYGTLKLIRVNPKKYELVSEMLLLEEETNPAFRPRPQGSSGTRCSRKTGPIASGLGPTTDGDRPHLGAANSCHGQDDRPEPSQAICRPRALPNDREHRPCRGDPTTGIANLAKLEFLSRWESTVHREY